VNCYDYQCDQGRNCPAREEKPADDKPEQPVEINELPITMDDDFMNFDSIMRWLRDLFAALGLVAMVGLIAFFFGYRS